MKTLVLTSLVLVSSLATAQRHTSISRNINDDGKTLSIRINGTVDGKPIDYNRTFDVARLNKAERDALREHVLDSLNVSMPEPPRPPVAPNAPQAPEYHRESMTITSSDRPTVSVKKGENQTVAVRGKQPYTKEVNYNSDSGQLILRYRFKKDGDDVTYERTIDAQNKSQEERQRIIADIEKAIGVPTTDK